MKLKSLLTSVSVALALVVSNCGGGEVKEKPEPPKVSSSDVNKSIADGLNRTLSVSGANEMSGFALGVSRLKSETIKKWDEGKKVKNPLTGKEEVVPGSAGMKWKALKESAPKVPEGYVLEITGHTDTVGGKAVNKSVSLNRARFAQQQLKKQGVDIKKTTVRGAGFSELKNAADGKADENRRVTLKVVKKK